MHSLPRVEFHLLIVTPAKAEVHLLTFPNRTAPEMDSRIRGNDEVYFAMRFILRSGFYVVYVV